MRSRTLRIPTAAARTDPRVPGRTVRRRSGAMPTPSSSTSTRSLPSWVILLRRVTVPPLMRGSSPCLMLFSMSGCSNIPGTTMCSVSSRNLFYNFELLAEANHFNVEIIVSEGKLFTKGDEGLTVFEQDTEDICELDDHAACRDPAEIARET